MSFRWFRAAFFAASMAVAKTGDDRTARPGSPLRLRNGVARWAVMQWRAARRGFLGTARNGGAAARGRKSRTAVAKTIEAQPVLGQTCPIEPAEETAIDMWRGLAAAIYRPRQTWMAGTRSNLLLSRQELQGRTSLATRHRALDAFTSGQPRLASSGLGACVGRGAHGTGVFCSRRSVGCLWQGSENRFVRNLGICLHL